jgi:tRNA pseudouridine-54 N-methylase
MREFVYFSRKAVTTGNFKDLADAGRMDIAIHTLIHAFFISRARRENVRLHFFFYGPPDPPKHLEINGQTESGENTSISKKDVAGLIRRLLYKYKAGKRIEALPGCFVEKEGLIKWLEAREGAAIYLLDAKGKDLRSVDIRQNPVFVLGDHEGFPQKELRRIKTLCHPVSVGKISYFASQVVAVVQNELDRREIS